MKAISKGDTVIVRAEYLAKVLKIHKNGFVEVRIAKAKDLVMPQCVSPFKKYKPFA